MSGRRHGYSGLASAAQLAVGLELQRQQEERQKKQDAANLYNKLQYELLLEEGKQLVKRKYATTPAIPSGLEPYEVSFQDQEGITRKYRRPEDGLGAVPPYEPPEGDQITSGKTRVNAGPRATMPAADSFAPPTATGGIQTTAKILRSGTDNKTGRKVGQTDGGQVIYLDTGEPYTP